MFRLCKIASAMVIPTLVLTGCGGGGGSTPGDKDLRGPTAIIAGLDDASIYVYDDIMLHASESLIGDSPIDYYAWSSEGKQWTGEFVTISYTTAGLKEITLTVADENQQEDSASVFVTVLDLDDDNIPPVARISGASNGQKVLVGQTVKLSGAGSSDEDGSIVNYQWKANGLTKSGSDVEFVFDQAGDVDVTLTVTDDKGALHSAKITLKVESASADNQPPVAVIEGSTGPFEVNERFSLSAAKSSDPDGDIVEYRWESEGETKLGESVQFSFATPGSKTITLTVTDDGGLTHSAVHSVKIEQPAEAGTPKAVISADSLNVKVGQDARFSGEQSSVTGASITGYQWLLNGEQVGTQEVLTYTFTEAGDYTLALIVTDSNGNTAIATEQLKVSSEAENAAPKAVISPSSSQTVTEGDSLNFDGSQSSDPDGDALSYEWSNGATTSAISVQFDTVGSENICLTVSDGELDDQACVSVTVEKKEEPQPEPGNIVYYKGSLTHVYAYGGTPGVEPPEWELAGWPGVAMQTKDGLKYIDLGDDFPGNGYVIFNDGGQGGGWSPQTDDLPFSLSSPCYDASSASDGVAGSWKTADACGGAVDPGPGPGPGPDPEEGYIYYNGSFINAYAWVANQEPVDQNAEWPGVKMETEGSLKKVKIDSRFDTIIFNAGDMTGDTSQQTTDLSINWSSPCYNGSSWTSVENCSDGGSTNPPPGGGNPPGDGFDGQRTAFVHLFEWHWDDIAKECTDFLGPKGVAAIQVSPPTEHITNRSEWWIRYQPVSYEFTSRSGNREQFKNMVQTCKEAGVDIYVDAVINHMAAWNRDFPKVPYGRDDFHEQCEISGDDYNNNAWRVRNCDLVGLNDLKTESDYVRGKIADYMNDAISMGVTGFRIDAAKHMEPGDIQAILGRLNNTWRNEKPYVFLEVIGVPGEAVQLNEYFGLDVGITSFKYERDAAPHFNQGNIANLKALENWMDMSSDKAVPFVVNHDDNNNGDHRHQTVHLHNSNGEAYYLANIFTLAYPYGYPKVYSGYLAEAQDSVPPSSKVHGGSQPACGFNNGPWTCEHRWHGIANMFDFRNHTAKEWRVTNWWDNGHDQIAFGRGGLGFIAITRGGPINQSFSTGMPDGEYCNIIVADFVDGACNPAATTGDAVITVSGGQAHFNVPGDSAAAIHVGAKIN